MSDRCENCRFWKDHGETWNFGECRRHAPAVGAKPPDKSLRDELWKSDVRWPNTNRIYWCGDYETNAAVTPPQA